MIPNAGIPPLPPPRSNKKPVILPSNVQNGHTPSKHCPPVNRTNSLPNRKRNGDLDKTLNAWSDGLLAEFNSIIANELTTLLAPEENGDDDNDVFVSSDDDSSMMRYRVTRSRSLGNQTPPPSPATSPSTSDTSSGSTGSGHYHRPHPITRVLCKLPRNDLVSYDRNDAILLRVSPLPDEDHAKLDDDETDGSARSLVHTPEDSIETKTTTESDYQAAEGESLESDTGYSSKQVSCALLYFCEYVISRVHSK